MHISLANWHRFSSRFTSLPRKKFAFYRFHNSSLCGGSNQQVIHRVLKGALWRRFFLQRISLSLSHFIGRVRSIQMQLPRKSLRGQPPNYPHGAERRSTEGRTSTASVFRSHGSLRARTQQRSGFTVVKLAPSLGKFQENLGESQISSQHLKM